MMNIKPSAAICKNYNQISKLCKMTKEPVYLTKNGEDDLVVMDVEPFARRESIIKLKEKLLQSELAIQKGRTYSIEETVATMRKAVAGVGGVRLFDYTANCWYYCYVIVKVCFKFVRSLCKPVELVCNYYILSSTHLYSQCGR